MSSGSKKGTQIYYPFLSKHPSKQIPSKFLNRAPMERDTHLQGIFTSLLVYLYNISFGVPSKGALPAFHPRGVPSERDAPFLEPSFIHHSKSLVYEPPPSRFQVPHRHKGAPMERYLLTGHFYIYLDISL